MDIIDIMLARAMTPQGQTETYVSIANAAAAKAEKAQEDAETAVATVEAAASSIEETQEAAETLLSTAQEVLETAQSAQINLPEAYSTTGQNTDGYMTQKATTDALALKADASALATKADASALAGKMDAFNLNDYASKTYVTQQISNITINNGDNNVNFQLSADDAGHLVTIDSDGNLIASLVTDEAVIEALLNAGTYIAQNAVGLDIDYANKTFARTQEAIGKSMGNDFNAYTMYGGRTRCNVADDGTINAFYGDNNYTEDGSNGQVMIYQPKFYYKRIIRSADELSKGKAIRHETLIISATEQSGFKLAPIFTGDLDYVLLPAFDAGLVSDKLTSIAGVNPVNNLTIAQAEAYANARGTGWHIMNMAAESANQMLEIVEFGTMNGQSAIENGITYVPDGTNGQCYFITGSTSSLGNGTGHATSTQINAGGNISTMTENGKRAISYRGMENPWGNFWSMIGGFNVSGNGAQGGGVPYLCTDFNYTTTSIGSNYEDIGFNLPSIYGWINAMGYGNEKYDWVYLPIECSNNANSLLPVGDGLWTVPNLNNVTVVATGGSFGFKEECGPFYYAADRTSQDSARNNYGAKLLFIPTKNEIYTANIAKWNTYMGE